MRITRTTLITAGLVLAVFAAGAEEPGHAPAASKDPRFEFLKQLEGTWVGDALSDEMGSEGVYEFRVTAGGHALEEREMIGTPMEMLTVYHMEGEDLVGTHFCMLGNRPRVRAAKRVTENTLSFACDGKPGNTRSHDEEHVHGWSMHLGEDGKLYYSAELVQANQITEAPTVVLTRQAR